MARIQVMAVSFAGLAAIASAQSPAPAATPAASPAASPSPSASPTPVPPPYTAAAPDARRGAELLDKAVAAHGGGAVFDAVQRAEFRGTSGRILPGQDPVEMASVTHVVLPDLYRHELTTKAGPIATMLNKEGAFVILGAGALPLPAAEAGALRATSRRNLITLFKNRKGLKAARVGAGRAGETALEMVEVEDAGEKTVLGIDPQTGLVRQAIYSMPMGGATAQVVATYSDIRPLAGGIKYPFRSQGMVDGKPVFSSRLETVVLNAPIDEKLFVPPAAAPEMPFPAPAPSEGPFSTPPLAPPAVAPSPSPSPAP